MNSEAEAGQAMPVALTIAGWAELPWLVHGFSTRSGGGSVVYCRPSAGNVDTAVLGGELNLGFTPKDSHETVARNRELYSAHLLGSTDGEEPGPVRLVTLRQTHSAIIHRVNASTASEFASVPVLAGDGLVTDAPGVLLGILTADCVPVLVVDPRLRAVAAFHAGWRGTVQQIVEQGIARMRGEFGSEPGELLAAVGPAIGACCYAVGEEVREQFRARFAYAEALFSQVQGEMGKEQSAGAWRLDLAEANRRQLLAAGLRAARITMTGECTCCEAHRFFSYRAERGVTGRMMAIVGVRRAVERSASG